MVGRRIGLMVVEIDHPTKPLSGSWLINPLRIHCVASFIARDKRDVRRICNPSPSTTRRACDKYD